MGFDNRHQHSTTHEPNHTLLPKAPIQYLFEPCGIINHGQTYEVAQQHILGFTISLYDYIN